MEVKQGVAFGVHADKQISIPAAVKGRLGFTHNFKHGH
jgi:hypothetical protein